MTTSLSELFSAIESVAFDAEMNVFSGFRSFLVALKEHPLMTQLVEAMQDSESGVDVVFERTRTLLEQEIDPAYMHPNDVTIAAYLYCLGEIAPERISSWLEPVASARQLWWSRRLAEHMRLTERH